MPTAYLNIGSNQGDRHALIEQAVALIECAYPGVPLRRAPVIESEPWGYESANPFLNLGIALDFPDGEPDPLALLDTLQGIERKIWPHSHRNPDGSYRDRGIDIDIIAIDGLTLSTPRLTLPHPRAHLRPFVTIPLQYLQSQK